MKIIKNLVLIVVVIFFSYYLSINFGNLYIKLLNQTAGSFIDGTSLIGFPLAYIFFLCFLFTLFGDKKKYWWIGIAIIPAAFFELYFDSPHLYFPIALGFIGWFLGWLILKLYKVIAKK